MFSHRPAASKDFALSLLALILCVYPARAQIGPVLSGTGPINRSMGGAAVAAPLDSLGALFWNPATTSALPNSLDVGVELLFPQTRLDWQIPASAFGPGLPPVSLSGSTWGENGVFALPSLGLVYRPDDSTLTYGLGVFAVAGFGVNYPASSLANPATANPILTPQPPNGFGLGALYSELQVLQIAPTATLQLTERLAFAIGPILDLSTLRVDPLFSATPNANGQYPAGTHVRTTWGGGFQAGLFYVMDGGWNLGVSFKSRQWMDNFHFNATDDKGSPRNEYFRLDVPMITSLGVGYTGIARWLLAADFRYVDFASTNGFRESGFDTTGALRGVGFRSIFAMSLGAQYQWTDYTSFRLGYSFNQNPISDSQSSFNVVSPTIVEHTIYVGASYRVSDMLTLSAAYGHSFQNSVAGPVETPLGTIPGSVVQNTTSADFLVIGAGVVFGARCCDQPGCGY